MRLIDADKIDYIMGEKPSRLDYVRRAHIADEPTIEAIPVAWIEKRMDSYIQYYNKKVKTEPAIAHSISNAIDAISELLDDWREENE